MSKGPGKTQRRIAAYLRFCGTPKTAADIAYMVDEQDWRIKSAPAPLFFVDDRTYLKSVERAIRGMLAKGALQVVDKVGRARRFQVVAFDPEDYRRRQDAAAAATKQHEIDRELMFEDNPYLRVQYAKVVAYSETKAHLKWGIHAERTRFRKQQNRYDFKRWIKGLAD